MFYINIKDYKNAEKVILKGKELSDSINPEISILFNLNLARIQYLSGDLENARKTIRGIPENLNNSYKGEALKTATEIYFGLDILDSAYIYAHTLANLKSSNNRKAALFYLTDPKFEPFVSLDSLREYINEYRTLSNKYMTENGNRGALIQNSIYNYTKHEQKRINAENDKRNLQKWIFLSIIAILILVCLLFYSLYRIKKNRLDLVKALANIKSLQSYGNSKSLDKEDNGDVEVFGTPDKNDETVQIEEKEYRQELKERLLHMALNDNGEFLISANILQSEIFNQIKCLIDLHQNISQNSPIWNELENVISIDSPKFKKDMYILTNGKLSRENYRMCLLIKCGISPTGIAILLCVAKNTISSRRKRLCFEIMGRDYSPTFFDKIIFLL